MIKNLELLSEAFDGLISLMGDYNFQTNLLASVNLEESDETDEIITERQQIIAQMSLAKEHLSSVVTLEDSDVASNIRTLVSGKPAVNCFVGGDKPIGERITEFVSLHNEILRKEHQIGVQMQHKLSETRQHLELGKKTNQSIKFLSSVNINSKGRTFEENA